MLRHKEPYVLYRKLLGFYPTDIHLFASFFFYLMVTTEH